MITLCTDSLRGYGLNRIFELTKKAGYDGIDLSVDFSQFDTYNTDYIKKLIAEYGVPVHAVSAPMEISPKRIQEVIEMAKEIGAKVVIIQPPKILDFKLAGWLKREIPRLREKEFISIALENAPAGSFLGFIPEHAMSNTQDLKAFKHVSLDTSRIGEKRQDLIRAYTAFKKFLVHIHISNFFHGKKYAPLHEGIIPLESFLTKLKQDRYPGAISIKILPKFLFAGDDEKLLEELDRAKKYYDKYYTKVDIGKVEEEEIKPEEQE